MKLRVAARDSKLSLIQVELVASRLRDLGYEVEVQGVKTRADLFQDRPLYSLGKGVFEKEVNVKVIDGEADIAVHSMKDLPSVLDERIDVFAVLPRDPPYDVLVSNYSIDDLKPGAVIGTSSVRRENFLKAYRKDIEVKLLRGNVDTRLRKLQEGLYDAIVLAEASITRMNLDVKYYRLDPHIMVPEPTQGIIAVVARKDRKEVVEALKAINDERTYAEATLERQVVADIGGGCHSPLGVLFRVNDNGIYGIAGISDGRRKVVVEDWFEVDDSNAGHKLAKKLKEAMRSEGLVLKA